MIKYTLCLFVLFATVSNAQQVVSPRSVSQYGWYLVEYKSMNVYVWGTPATEGIQWDLSLQENQQQLRLAQAKLVISPLVNTQRETVQKMERPIYRKGMTDEEHDKLVEYNITHGRPSNSPEAAKALADAPGGPKGLDHCPKCGAAGYQSVHSCGYKFDWDNTPEQWKSMLSGCPYDNSPLTFTDRLAKCSKCRFMMVIDPTPLPSKPWPRKFYNVEGKKQDAFGNQP